MQQVVAKVGLGRRVVREFQDEVNALLNQGFRLQRFTVEKKGLFKIFCTAILNDQEISVEFHEDVVEVNPKKK